MRIKSGRAGRMISDGILVLNKPQNWTSHDCVAICRRVLRLKGIKKIGHGGTLDPMAEGVLPIFIGQATRIMEYLELDYKKYTCESGTVEFPDALLCRALFVQGCISYSSASGSTPRRFKVSTT